MPANLNLTMEHPLLRHLTQAGTMAEEIPVTPAALLQAPTLAIRVARSAPVHRLILAQRALQPRQIPGPSARPHRPFRRLTLQLLAAKEASLIQLHR
jgi:hypothetical protein